MKNDFFFVVGVRYQNRKKLDIKNPLQKIIAGDSCADGWRFMFYRPHSHDICLLVGRLCRVSYIIEF